MLEWLQEQAGLLRWALIVAVAISLSSLVVLPLAFARMPRDYFAAAQAPPREWSRSHPVLQFGIRVLRCVVGLLLLVLGCAMLVLPGQGILTILVALSVLEFPGKRRFELWLVRRPRVLRALNWLRAKAGAEPLDEPFSYAG